MRENQLRWLRLYDEKKRGRDSYGDEEYKWSRVVNLENFER